MTELAEALLINEAAIGSDRIEYQLMLKNSFDGMLERLSAFFEGEKVYFFIFFLFYIINLIFNSFSLQ